MKRTNAPPIPEDIRIELNGEQEWKDVMQVFEDAGWVWFSGQKPHEKQTCSFKTIETTKDKKIAYITGRPITTKLTAAQFLQQYQETIEYEVGDWVVILEDQSGDPEGTVTQVINVNNDSVCVRNITRTDTALTKWGASANKIRPATPEEIASVTKVEPVAVKKPELYIWDGDVLPDEYWVENPDSESCEIAQYLKMLTGGIHWTGDGIWYKITPEDVIPTEKKQEDDLPIVPYELWKQILTTPDNQVKQPAVEKWSIVTTDGVKVYEGDIVWWLNPSGSWYGNEKGDKVLFTDKENHKDHNKLLFSTFEAAEEYISKQKQPAGRKWKVGDRYCNPADMADDVDIPNTEGWYIKQVSRDNYKVETVDGEDKMSRYSYTAKQIDNYIKRGDWIPYSESKEKEDNTTNNKTKNQTTNNGNNKQKQQQDSYSSNINNQNSGYSGTTLNLRTDQETISTGSRSTGTSLRCSGQSELFAVQHSGYPKGSGYCEEV
jgi:hypothetical protein